MLKGLAVVLFAVGLILLIRNPWGVTRALRLSLPFHLAFMLTLEALSLYLFVQAFGDVTDILPLGFFSLAWLVGYVVIGAPGGLGVREAAYVALLQPFVGDIGTLAAIALTLRLVTVMGDALFSALAIVYTSKKQQA